MPWRGYKLKILVVSKYFEPFKGGVETVVLEVCRRLVKKGYEVTVIASNHEKAFKTTVEKIEGIKVVRTPTWFRFGNAPISPGVFTAVLKEDYDVLHLHSPNSFSNPLAFLANLFKKKPIIVTYHSDIIPHSIIMKVFKPIYENTFKRIILNSAKVIMPTSPQYVEISDTLPKYRKKIMVVPNGISLKEFKPSKKRKNNTILFLGRLIYYKGLDVLLEAMKKVVEEVPDAVLLIAGSGELEGELKKKAKELGIAKNVKFLGRVSEEEKEKLMKQCTVFVLPSVHKSEAFGVVILEAMAYGAPVITTDVSGTVFAAGDAGIIVKHGDSKQLAEAIVKVLKDKTLRKKMTEKGLKHVKKFDWDEIVKKVEKLLPASNQKKNKLKVTPRILKS